MAHIMTHITHIRVITQALNKIAAHTPPDIKAGSGTQNIHKVLIQGKTTPPQRQGEEPTGREHM
jgi:hypothetical protein